MQPRGSQGQLYAMPEFPQTTFDYQLVRNRRMSKFMSPEKKHEYNLLKNAGHNKMNDPLALTNGFIVN